MKLGARGSVHSAGAAIGGRATCQPCLRGAARPVPGAQTFPGVSRSPVAFIQGCNFIVTLLRVTLGGMETSAASRAESRPPSWSSLHGESRRLADVETSPLRDTCMRSGVFATSKGP